MGKLRNTALILGEGPTEFYYFKSLCDVFKGLTIKPDYPKDTNIKDLDAKIAEGVELGFNHIFCIIDMDTDQEQLLKDLNLSVEYRKTAEFFIKCKGLHSYFERNGGSLATAVANAEHSMDEKQASGRDYTYSELGRLMEELKRLEEK